MKSQTTSRALETNLALTRSHSVTIPPDHQKFIELSASTWAIHQKSKGLMTEYHHLYSNRPLVIKQWREVFLGYFWFYHSLPDAEDAFKILIDIGKDLLYSDVGENERHRIIQTLLEFIENLTGQEQVREHVVQQCLDTIEEYISRNELDIIMNNKYFQTCLGKAALLPQFAEQVFQLTQQVLQKSITYWESTSAIERWLEEKKLLFYGDQVQMISVIGGPYFAELKEKINGAKEWQELTGIPSFDQIANHFRQSVSNLEMPLDRMYFLSYLLYLPGMKNSSDNLLLDMNRSIKDIHKQFSEDDFISFLTNLLFIFNEFKENHMSILLDYFLTLGKEVIDTQNPKLIDFYEGKLIQFGFVSPGAVKITDDWQVQVDANHIKNIRVWLELIEYAPSMMRKLLTALIVNLRLSGIFIADTDLFQRDITRLLNSDITPFYKQIKQLCRIFPVYFTEIGCEGKLRDLTTAIDEISQRKDRLIHFLRKQVHAESNNTHIELTQRIIQFWYDGKLENLKPDIPVDVLEAIDLNSEWFVPIHHIVEELCSKENCTAEQLLLLTKEELEVCLAGITVHNNRNEQRLLYLIDIYALLREKYSFEIRDIVATLKQYSYLDNNSIDNLASSIDGGDFENALKHVYRLMVNVNEVILDTRKSEAWESIYYKRHIAAGIPSMYGQYRETKFEALGLVFRLEKFADRLMCQLIETVNLDYVTARILRRIYDVLSLFQEGLKVNGVYNQDFEYHMKMFKFTFKSSSFSLNQYINILQFLGQDIKEIIKEYFLRVYDDPLRIIINQLDKEQETSENDLKQLSAKMSEKFYREVLASSFMIQSLDNFVTASINATRTMLDNYTGKLIHQAMTYNPNLVISPLYKQTKIMDNPVFLGEKAYFLKRLNSLGFPIPQGFVLTTELFRHEEIILKHPSMFEEMDKIIKSHIALLEKNTGRQFGNPEHPLLLSVRSGSAFSMPGAMNTFLNIGMNDKIAEAFGAQPVMGWAAWDCYRRLLQSWGMSYGIERDAFDNIIQSFKSRDKVAHKVQFSEKQMREIAYEYQGLLNKHGVSLENDPYLQLRQALFNVLSSWTSPRTRTYRERLAIADEWGTAIIVQRMIFGNINTRSGSGVLFTYDPHIEKPGVNLCGDFTTCSQGEDIVAGLVHALPISDHQLPPEIRNNNISLESAFPQIYQRLFELCTEILQRYDFGHQEIEFTFESDQPNDLYILQTRMQNIEVSNIRPVFDIPQERMRLVGRGVGIGGGALSGIIAIDMNDMESLSAQYPDENIILVRPDTVPDDIGMIFQCAGLLTGRGGITSHAAVTATRLGKVCIVGCKELAVKEKDKMCTINGTVFKPGDKISIEGFLGNIYAGQYPRKFIEVN